MVWPVFWKVRVVERETTLCVKLPTTGALKIYFSNNGSGRFLLSNVISVNKDNMVEYRLQYTGVWAIEQNPPSRPVCCILLIIQLTHR